MSNWQRNWRERTGGEQLFDLKGRSEKTWSMSIAVLQLLPPGYSVG